MALKIKKNGFNMTNILIYCHTLILFIPWTPVHYIPSWIGPIDVWIVIFILALYALIIEILYSGKIQKMNFLNGLVIFWFVLINIVGLSASLLEVNPVRKNIPILIQIARAIPYADGFLVYYLIQKNKWGINEFERFAKIVLIPGVIISFECFLIFYLKIPLGINEYSVYTDENVNWFVSVFCRHKTHPGPIGLIVVGLSLYFFIKYRLKRYLFYSMLGVGLVLANVTLLAYLGLISGFVLVFIFFLFSQKNTRKIVVAKFLILFLLIGFLFGALTLGNRWRPVLTDSHVLMEKAMRRAYQITRSLDVLVNYPFFGAGPGIGFYYAYSRDTIPIVSDAIVGYIPEKKVGLNWAMEDPYNDGDTYSIHSFFANLWMDLGIMGAIIPIFLYLKWTRLSFKVFLLRLNGKVSFIDCYTMVSLFALIIAISIFIFGKPKFYPFWFFSFLIAFVNQQWAHSTSLKMRNGEHAQ